MKISEIEILQESRKGALQLKYKEFAAAWITPSQAKIFAEGRITPAIEKTLQKEQTFWFASTKLVKKETEKALLISAEQLYLDREEGRVECGSSSFWAPKSQLNRVTVGGQAGYVVPDWIAEQQQAKGFHLRYTLQIVKESCLIPASCTGGQK